MLRFNPLHGFKTVPGFADNFEAEIAVEKGTYLATGRRFIIHNESTDLHVDDATPPGSIATGSCPRPGAESGNSTVTRRPCGARFSSVSRGLIRIVAHAGT